MDRKAAHSNKSKDGGKLICKANLPFIEDFIVRKMKQFIRKKMVSPNCQKFRLIWPRNWWPVGMEKLFLAPPVSVPSHPLTAGQLREKALYEESLRERERELERERERLKELEKEKERERESESWRERERDKRTSRSLSLRVSPLFVARAERDLL